MPPVERGYALGDDTVAETIQDQNNPITPLQCYLVQSTLAQVQRAEQRRACRVISGWIAEGVSIETADIAWYRCWLSSHAQWHVQMLTCTPMPLFDMTIIRVEFRIAASHHTR